MTVTSDAPDVGVEGDRTAPTGNVWAGVVDRGLRRLIRLSDGRPRMRRAVRSMLPSFDIDVDGFRLRVSPRDNLSEFKLWYHGRPSEPRSIARLVEIAARPDTFVLDIGANVGAFTLPLARALGKRSRLVALEPNPVMMARLRTNLARNGLAKRVELIEAAAGVDGSGAELSIHDRNLGQSTLCASSGTARRLSVPTVNLAELLYRERGRRVVVKIDIEGYEDRVLMPVFRGADTSPIDYLLIETQHRSVWTMPLLATIRAAGMRPVFRGEGNTLFVRRGIADVS